MKDNSYMDELVNFGNMLADKSEEIIMQYFRHPFDIQTKEDNSPVTIADKKSEEKMRLLIHHKFPEHGIIGEEFEEKVNIKNEYTWVLDPIDGTRSFIAGHKDFGTLIALLHNKKPILGIINCPAHKERWVGIYNRPTLLNNSIAKTSNNKLINESYIFTSGLYFEEQKFKNNCDKIFKKVKYYRFGGDCYMYGMLASGLIDIVVEDTLKVHDYMALIPVIEGAGGIVTDKNNNSINLNSNGSIIASANIDIHKQIFKILK